MKKNEKASRHVVRYDTDVAAKKIWLQLLRDFRGSEGQDFCRKAEDQFMSGISAFRDYEFPELGFMPVRRYKRYMQLSSLLKKYRFKHDKYTDDELDERTLNKFFQDQAVFASHKPLSLLSHRVLQRARLHAKRILGRYDPEYTCTCYRFGKKSSIGCPYSLAYIDHKLGDARAFTGSSECAQWFYNEVLSNEGPLRDHIERMGFTVNDENCNHESLTLVNVPKTWKTHRPITPLTLLGLAYSYGVGEQVDLALRSEGIDIRRQQHRHRKIVEWASRNRKYATADLSNASNALLSWLLNRTLPREWYTAIKRTFSHQLVINGVEGIHYTESVLPMGNGLTFPVETLVFYVILKAIAELAEVKGFISVYGDDLIYPSRLHKYVSCIFPLIGFTINKDKTFVKAPFRESCGSDFYRGHDVRPAFLPDSHQLLSRKKYTAWLYKVYNALCRRWDEEEIRSTLMLILTELAMTGETLYRVPPSYPDGAGIRVSDPTVTPLDTNLLPWEPILLRFTHGSRWFVFKYLVMTPKRRYVKSVFPYYWLALKRLDDVVPQSFWDTDFSGLASVNWDGRFSGLYTREKSWKFWEVLRPNCDGVVQLRYETRKFKRVNRRTKRSFFITKKVPFVDSKTESTIGVGSSEDFTARANVKEPISDWI